MSSANSMWEVGAVVLGHIGAVASWRRSAAGSGHKLSMLVIQTSEQTRDGVHQPTASVIINSRIGLLALRGAIDEALKEPQA